MISNLNGSKSFPNRQCQHGGQGSGRPTGFLRGRVQAVGASNHLSGPSGHLPSRGGFGAVQFLRCHCEEGALRPTWQSVLPAVGAGMQFLHGVRIATGFALAMTTKILPRNYIRASARGAFRSSGRGVSPSAGCVVRNRMIIQRSCGCRRSGRSPRTEADRRPPDWPDRSPRRHHHWDRSRRR